MIRHTQNLFRTFPHYDQYADYDQCDEKGMIGLIYYYLTILLKKDGDAHDP